jgi:hypothetical protein
MSPRPIACRNAPVFSSLQSVITSSFAHRFAYLRASSERKALSYHPHVHAPSFVSNPGANIHRLVATRPAKQSSGQSTSRTHKETSLSIAVTIRRLLLISFKHPAVHHLSSPSSSCSSPQPPAPCLDYSSVVHRPTTSPRGHTLSGANVSS